MNNMNLKVVTEKDNIILGSHFHKLEDESSSCYHTDNIPVFFEYLKSIGEECTLFYNLYEIRAIPKIATRYGDSIAVLQLKTRTAFELLKDANDSRMSLDQFETFLRKMRPYMDPGGLELLSNLKDFRINKVQKVIRKKNRQTGNYEYSVSRESAGNEDFNPPSKIKFEMAMYNHVGETFEIEMDFEFNFRPYDEEVRLDFTLNNVHFEELEEFRTKEILDERLSNQDNSFFWGNVENEVRDDSWRYKKNPIRE